jgi:hypothetical protein
MKYKNVTNETSMAKIGTQLVPTWREGDDYGRDTYDTFENKQL